MSSSMAMDMEDYYFQAKAQIAAQEEQIDNLVAMVRDKDRQIESLTARLNRMTVALDDALAIVRGIKAREAAVKAEAEALEL